MLYKDYYQIMGLSRYAGQDDIKRAYRRLARKFHPDVSQEPNAEAKFKALSEAYELLKDPVKKAQYDRRVSFNPTKIIIVRPQRTMNISVSSLETDLLSALIPAALFSFLYDFSMHLRNSVNHPAQRSHRLLWKTLVLVISALSL